MFKKKPKRSKGLDLDRSLLQWVARSSHPDDQFSLRDMFEHVLITGSTGSGKTSTVGYALAQALLQSQDLPEKQKIGICVFLYKSSDQLLWQTWCEAQGREEDLIIIDDRYHYVFNLLAHYKDQEAGNAVNALMNLSNLSLSGYNQGNSEAYWEQAKRQRLHRLVVLNQLCGEPLNVATLYALHSTAPQHAQHLGDSDFMRESYCMQMLNQAADKVGEDDPRFRLISHYFTREMPLLADRTRSSILSLTSAILEPFVSSPLLHNLFCQDTTLDLDDLLKGKIVLFNFPIQQWEYSGKLAQILFKYILCKRIESRDLTKLPNPVILWLDEYQHYITPYDFLFLSTARSSRAGCVLMTQTISNLYAQIGGQGRIAEEKVNALLSLTNHKVFLAQNGFTTNEFASKTIGMDVQPVKTHTVQLGVAAGSASISERYQYQVQPKDFNQLKRGGPSHQGEVEAIITATGKTFSTGKNYVKRSFIQPWYQK